MSELNENTAAWTECTFNDLLDYIQPTNYIVDSTEYDDNFSTPVLTAGKSFIKGYTNEEHGIFENLPVIIFDDFTTASKYVNFSFKVKSSAMKILIPCCELVDLKLLYYFMQANPIRSDTHKRYWISVYAKKSLLLPPINEQKRIVAKIEALFSELDKGIESLKTARQQLKVYRQAVLKHAFEGKLTAEWREKNKDKLETADELLERIKQEREATYRQLMETWEKNGKEGKKPAALKKTEVTLAVSSIPDSWIALRLECLALEAVLGKMLDKQKNKGMARPYLGNINLRWGSFDLTNLKKMKIEESEVARYSLKKGDLVICEGGEPGRCAIWDGSNDSMFIQKALHRVRFTPSYKPKFAYYFMVYATITGMLNHLFTGTTIKHLTGKGLSQVLFPVPSITEQDFVCAELDKKISFIEQLETDIDEQIQRTEALRQSILKRAFSGKLVAQDPNDEPASALLERIKVEKNGTQKKKRNAA